MTDSIIERAARVLCIAAGLDPNQRSVTGGGFQTVVRTEPRRSDDGPFQWQRFIPQVRAVLQAIREPIDGWLTHQIDHGYAPDGFSVEMTAEYALGRASAFHATKVMIDAALEEG